MSMAMLAERTAMPSREGGDCDGGGRKILSDGTDWHGIEDDFQDETSISERTRSNAGFDGAYRG